MKPQPMSDAEIGLIYSRLTDKARKLHDPRHGDVASLARAIIAARDAQWAAMIVEPEPLTDDAIEQAYNEAWRSLPSDFGHTSGDWFEAGARYASAEVERAVAAERGRVRNQYETELARLRLQRDEDVAAERERCAKVCEDLLAYDEDDPGQSFAAAIRADPQRLQGKGE